MYDIIIIGAGIAGLSAAIYGKRAGKSVLVLEKLTFGGQIVNAQEIENYPGIHRISGYDFALSVYTQAENLGAEIKFENVTSVINGDDCKKVITDSSSYKAKSIIIATGSKRRQLGLKRENDLIGSGVSYCAACDGAFFRGKRVAVCGGGNTAIEDAEFLSNYCETVYLIHRRSEFRAELKNIEKLRKRNNVEFILSAEIITLLGNEILSGIEYRNNKSQEIHKLNIDGLFIAIGQEPDNEIFKELLKLDSYGYIEAGEDCKTNIDGIYAAGDCRTKSVRQLATAASDGVIAALAASVE